MEESIKITKIRNMSCDLDKDAKEGEVDFDKPFLIEYTVDGEYQGYACVNGVSTRKYRGLSVDLLELTLDFGSKNFYTYMMPDDYKSLFTVDNMTKFLQKRANDCDLEWILLSKDSASDCCPLLQYCLEGLLTNSIDMFYLEDDDEMYINAVKDGSIEQLWNDVKKFGLDLCLEYGEGYIAFCGGLLCKFLWEI